MSNTKIYIGKLAPVKTIKNHQVFMDFVHKNKLTTYLEDSIEDFLGGTFIEALIAINRL